MQMETTLSANSQQRAPVVRAPLDMSDAASAPAETPVAANDDAAPQTAPQQHYAVVVNNSAGSSSKFTEEALRAASPGATFDVDTVAPEGLEAAFNKAFAAKPTAVIVVGGDGTARTAAVRALQTGIPIIPMPGGTMNVLPKIIFGHDDMVRAMQDIPRLELQKLDVGRIGGEPFFLSAAVGLAGPMARVREAARSKNKFKRMLESGSAFFRGLGPSLRHRVRWKTPTEKWRKVHSLVIAIGDFDRVLAPDTEDHGSRFEVASLKVHSIWQMIAFGAAFITGDWRNSDRLKIVRTREVDLQLPGRRPLVVLDGEPTRVSHVGKVTLERGALPVLSLPSDTSATTA